MANTLSNTHRVLDRKIKELEEYSPHKSQHIKSLKINKLHIQSGVSATTFRRHSIWTSAELRELTWTSSDSSR